MSSATALLPVNDQCFLCGNPATIDGPGGRYCSDTCGTEAAEIIEWQRVFLHLAFRGIDCHCSICVHFGYFTEVTVGEKADPVPDTPAAIRFREAAEALRGNHVHVIMESFGPLMAVVMDGAAEDANCIGADHQLLAVAELILKGTGS